MDNKQSLRKKSDNLNYLLRHRFDVAMSGALVYAGVDEVGRGCLAGPVVAAAVIPPQDVSEWWLVDDSKRVKGSHRKVAFDLIQESARAIAVGAATSEEIDGMNIFQATKLAMRRAVHKLQVMPQIVLVDGNQTMDLTSPTLPVVSGDVRSLSIAAASIVAKVYRDDYMKRLDKEYPQYGFLRHVGYGTKEHIAALKLHGPMIEHRMSFSPVRNLTQTALENQYYG